MSTRRALAGAFALALLVLVGCSSTTTTATPTAVTPAATDLLADSSSAMSSVTSAGFGLKVDGQLPSVAVQTAQGVLTAAGDAKGTATIVQFGQLIEAEFVLVGGELYVKGATGGFAKVPAALAGSLYDPAAILDPGKGVAKVLASVQNPTITGSDGGAWLVSGTVPAAVIGALVPGIGSDVTAVFTVEMTGAQLSAATFTLDGADGKPATVTVELSDLNQPVSISPPG